MSLLELFCHVDDFCRASVPELQQMQLASGALRRNRARSLSLSEIMTILIRFHCSGYRNFKTYYQAHVQHHIWPSCSQAEPVAEFRCKSANAFA